MRRWAGVSLALVFCGGCQHDPTLDLRLGKLRTLEQTLIAASGDCDNEALRNVALNWVIIGIKDLQMHNARIDPGSSEHRRATLLIRELSPLTSRRKTDAPTLCARIHNAARHTQDYLQLQLSAAN
ncbi:MAG: hypothetical protein AB1810_01545 [Pseudomonadota bacterium]